MTAGCGLTIDGMTIGRVPIDGLRTADFASIFNPSIDIRPIHNPSIAYRQSPIGDSPWAS
jgi:hypothetical protein